MQCLHVSGKDITLSGVQDIILLRRQRSCSFNGGMQRYSWTRPRALRGWECGSVGQFREDRETLRAGGLGRGIERQPVLTKCIALSLALHTGRQLSPMSQSVRRSSRLSAKVKPRLGRMWRVSRPLDFANQHRRMSITVIGDEPVPSEFWHQLKLASSDFYTVINTEAPRFNQPMFSPPGEFPKWMHNVFTNATTVYLNETQREPEPEAEPQLPPSEHDQPGGTQLIDEDETVDED